MPPPIFTGPDNGRAVVPVTFFISSLATFLLILRFTARYVKKAKIGVDDVIITLSVMNVWALSVLAYHGRKAGLGRHVQTLSPGSVEDVMEILYYSQVFYIPAPISVKVSLVFLYKRIFGDPMHKICNILAGMLLVWLLITFFIAIFICTPISAFWTRQGTCIDFKQFVIGFAVLNISTSLFIWFLPLPSIWRLHLPLPQRIGLSFVFLLGLFDCAATLTRLLSSMLVIGSADPTWDLAPGFIWSIIEPAVGIICACLPTVRIVFLAVGPFVPKSWHASRSKSRLGSKDRQRTFQPNFWPRSETYNTIRGPFRNGSANAPSRSEGELQMISAAAPMNGIVVSHDVRVESQSTDEESRIGV